MVKRTYIYLVIFVALLLGIFLLTNAFSGSSIFNIFGAYQQFAKKEVNLYLYDQPDTSINQVLVRVYYCLPQDGQQFGLNNWQNILTKTGLEISDFYQLQFKNQMQMEFEVQPQIFYLKQTAQYYTDLINGDYEREKNERHSESRTIETLLNELGDSIKESTDDVYLVNVYILSIDPDAVPDVIGLADEFSNNSIVYAAGFVDERYKDSYSSAVAHEIGHNFGIPDFYNIIGPEVYTAGLMGNGYEKELIYNYIDYKIKDKMTD